MSELVGRHEEIGSLRSSCQSLDLGGRFIVVEGPAGSGKSTLLSQLAALVADDPVLGSVHLAWATCNPHVGSENAYGPIADLLAGMPVSRHRARRGRRVVARAAPELLALVPAVGPIISSATRAAQAMLEASSATGDVLRPYRASLSRLIVDSIVKSLPRGRTTIMVVDDAHVIDPSSLAVLDNLATLLPDHPLGIVLAVRTGEAETGTPVAEAVERWERAGLVVRIALRSLDEGAVGRLASEVLSQPVSPAVSRQLTALTGGNPLFLEQTLRLLISARPPHRLAEADLARLVEAGELPTSVDTIVQRRLGPLDKTTTDLLVIGATQGDHFMSAVVERLSDLSRDEVLDRLYDASRQVKLIEPVDPPPWVEEISSDYYRFEHGLVRIALQKVQSPQRARDRHARIGSILLLLIEETPGAPLSIRLDTARHFHLGRRHPEAARTYLAIAKHLAIDGLSFAEAASLCRTAVTDLRQVRSPTAETDRCRAEAIELFLSLTEVRWSSWSYESELGTIDDLAREAQDAARRSNDPVLLNRATIIRGKVALTTHGLTESLHHLEQAVTTARQSEDVPSLFISLAEYGRQLPKRDLEAGLTILREAEALFTATPALHRSQDPVVVHARNLTEMQIGVNVFDAGDLWTARQRLVACSARLRQQRSNIELPIALNYLAQVELALGDIPSAITALDEAIAFERTAGGGPSGWHAYNTALLATARLDDGSPELCRQLVQAAWSETQETWLANLVPIVRNLYADVLLATAAGDPDQIRQADRLADETIAETQRTGMVRSQVAAHSLKSRTQLALGSPTAATASARQALALLDQFGHLPALRTEDVLYHAAIALHRSDHHTEAQALIERAKTEVMTKANLIPDPQTRTRYLTAVPINRLILHPADEPPPTSLP